MSVKEKGSIPLLHPEAPQPVKIATLLFALVWLRQMFFLVSLLEDAREGLYASQVQREAIATLAFWLVLNATLMLAMVYQKNWARNTQALSTLAGLLLIVWDVIAGNDFNPGIVYLSNAVATVLLFLPSADAWFKKRQY
ncbi:hypothetical protein [Paraburkholderia lycopersici]|uniref:Uncharacterized protein n=1 Tax=Paraburkholderia lycopersici TaxID=416944 RepID=A0A1G7CJX2_9BURK|nr:hypothetical protein [Paraburkholderia lycopersici]SDE39658.1 hypothetical protein SAMN05421548_1466 [Paraburkholderia lycopersici]